LNSIKAMLFDLDGTLLDSAPDLIAALNWLRFTEGLPALDTAVMSRYVSYGAAGILNAGMPPASADQFAQWKTLFLDRYAAVGYRESRLYDGISDVLQALDKLDMPWGIVTNKMESLTRPILESAGLLNKAASVVCGDTLSRNKPDPAPVLFACKQLAVDPAKVIFAGDDVRDLQAGKSAGSMTAAVLYGYGSHEFSADLLCDSVVIKQPADFRKLLE